MSLGPYEPFRHMDNWRQELERLLEPLAGPFYSMRMPRMDVYETEEEVIVSAELPGLEKKDDVQIDVDDDHLTITGTIQRAEEVKEDRMHRRERYVGQFRRSISLPARVKSDKARATYRNGILEVRIPKDETPNRRRVDIEFN